jgi:hypothetical protein
MSNIPDGPVANIGTQPDPKLVALIKQTIIDCVLPEALKPGVIEVQTSTDSRVDA